MEEKKEIRERNPYVYDFEKLPDSEWYVCHRFLMTSHLSVRIILYRSSIGIMTLRS
jgi:hypothetical protein